MLLLPFSRQRNQSSQLPLLMILSGLLLLVVEATFAVGAVKTYDDMLGKKLRKASQRGVSRKSPSPNSQNVVLDPVTQPQEEEEKLAIIADGGAVPFSKSLSTLGVIVTALLLLCLSLVVVACVLQLCKVCRDQQSGGWTDQQAEHPQPAARPMKAVFLRPHPEPPPPPRLPVPPPTPKTGASGGSQLPAPRPPGLPGPRASVAAASGPSAANQVAPSVDSRSLNDEATNTTSSSSYSSDSDGERKRQILARY